ncbi:type II toxin-antitoxin system HicA family toxin [Actinocorallia sp. API 0066]|uniref:type II toxin-antitoxin system HicA family toxin n=1 Tax=Actinocorallia sp. API 0066 TaxID=2896846 RepID=UPI001E5C686A|nr:type II toxin-antitoxin system HicA family toxin [Actinocorallia sp. API 0066]MCD0448724.1 type II toxin-antitoxin system HicA family toxin [Actinocorallia sp. API 0066]
MPPLPVASGAAVVKALEKAGFELVRTKGSHHMMTGPSGRFTVVPVHRGKDLPPGTLRRIIADAGLSVGEFIELL